LKLIIAWRWPFVGAAISTGGIPLPGHDRFEFRDPFGNRVGCIQWL
jgi:hypothetical protein